MCLDRPLRHSTWANVSLQHLAVLQDDSSALLNQSLYWYRRHAAQRSAIALSRWPQLGLGTLCRSESWLLRRSSHFGGNWKLNCFKNHILLFNTTRWQQQCDSATLIKFILVIIIIIIIIVITYSCNTIRVSCSFHSVFFYAATCQNELKNHNHQLVAHGVSVPNARKQLSVQMENIRWSAL